jgi:hypothetical protein
MYKTLSTELVVDKEHMKRDENILCLHCPVAIKFTNKCQKKSV